jgi:energy-coupling factor transporter ATP-binding protein EcfA2
MAKLPRIVAFIGPIGSGKTTAAQCLKPLGYHRISFADPLKQMLMTLGLTHEQVYGAEKETPSQLLCGITPRWAMQSLGTEWGRNHIHPDLWVRAWQHRCQTHQLVTVDDMRFPNEYKTLRALNGIVIRINRQIELATTPAHESEIYRLEPDTEIFNGSSIERFKRDVIFAVQSFE